MWNLRPAIMALFIIRTRLALPIAAAAGGVAIVRGSGGLAQAMCPFSSSPPWKQQTWQPDRGGCIRLATSHALRCARVGRRRRKGNAPRIDARAVRAVLGCGVYGDLSASSQIVGQAPRVPQHDRLCLCCAKITMGAVF